MTNRPHNRSMLIVAVVVVMMLGLRFGSHLFSQRTGKVDPHINLSEGRLGEITERQRQQQISAFVAVTEGEVFRTGERIREATALATATSLFAASESLNRRIPASVTALLIGIAKAGLIPPGLQIVDSVGNVSSVHARLLVRYRTDPLSVEVISLAKVPMDGPALLVRVPADRSPGAKNEAASLYLATTLESSMPSPFASEAEIFALGFAPEPFRATKLPKP